MTLEVTAAGSMRAIVQDGYGPAGVLRLARVARPEIADSEVLLRVHAAGLDRGTWHLMTGRPYLLRLVCGLRRPRQPVAGLDVAGTVVAAGPGVTRFCAGDEVFGFGRGTFAEYTTAREDRLARMPGNLTFEQAAVVPVSAVQRLTMLTPRQRSADLERVTEFVEAGTVIPSISATYPLDQVRQAMRQLAAGQARGKIAITV